jgi:hypothetical protein
MPKRTLLQPLHHDLVTVLRDILDREGVDAFLDTAQRVMEVTAVVVIQTSGRNPLYEILDDLELLADALEQRRTRVLN